MKITGKPLVLFFCFFLIPSFSFAHSSAKKNLVIGVLPIAGHLPLVVAEKDTAMMSKGIKIKLDIYSSWTALEAAFRVKAVDGAAIDVARALNMAYEGVPLKIVSIVSRNGTAIVLEKDRPEALKGKIVGNSGDNTMQLLIFKEFIKKLNLRLGYDVRSVLISFPRALYYLQAKDIFGFVLPEPYGMLAEKAKLRVKTILSGDILPDHIGSVLVVQPEVAEKYPAETKALVKALQTAQDFIEKDRIKTGGEQTAIMQTDVFNFKKDVVRKTLAAGSTRISFKSPAATKKEIKEIETKLISAGILEGKSNLANVILELDNHNGK